MRAKPGVVTHAAALLIALVGCGRDGGIDEGIDGGRDGGIVDAAADVGRDGFMEDANLDADAGDDGDLGDDAAVCDLGSRTSCGGCDVRCGAREYCEEGGCACAESDVLCTTAGYATFPMPDPSRRGAPRPASYVVGTDTAVDGVTGLEWERGSSAVRLTFVDAANRCATLVVGGRDDFRLPSRVELASILDATRTPSIDTAAFMDTPSDYFWTSSLAPGLDGSAYGIYFGGGEVVSASVSRAGAYARCVAGPATVPAEGQHDAGVDAVLDRGTGLRWSRALLGPMDHDAAVAACAALDLDGVPGRIPTINELSTTVDEGSRGPVLDEALFAGSADAELWSGTTRDLGVTVAWVLDLDDGETRTNETDQAHFVRCVR